jgi:hypothetical protein
VRCAANIAENRPTHKETDMVSYPIHSTESAPERSTISLTMVEAGQNHSSFRDSLLTRQGS